jgi:hypothetical protein
MVEVAELSLVDKLVPHSAYTINAIEGLKKSSAAG